MNIEPPIPGQQRNEAWWCSRTVEIASRLGLMAHHCRDSRSCQGRRGFPDLVIAGPGNVLFAEVKVRGGETTAEQDLWAWTLTEAGHRFVIWDFPQDWDKALQQMSELFPVEPPSERKTQ